MKELNKEVFGNSDSFLVYGLEFCCYNIVISHLLSPNLKIYDYCNFPYEHFELPSLVYNNKLVKLWCKTIILNLVFENYKRLNENQPIIPLIFCTEYEGVEYGKNIKRRLDVEQTAQSRHGRFTVADSELRRCYKISHEMEPKICDIAKRSFRFAKVIKEEVNGRDDYRLELIEPFWNSRDWSNQWEKRKQSKNYSALSSAGKWKEQLNKRIDSYEKEHHAISTHSCCKQSSDDDASSTSSSIDPVLHIGNRYR